MTVRVCSRAEEFRIHEADNPGQMDPYDAFANVVWWRRGPNGIVAVEGMHGTVSRKTLFQIFEALVQRGARLIYADRAPRRTLPYAEKIVGGDFDGMWRIDITKAVTLREKHV